MMMENSLDILLAPALRETIEENLGKSTLSKIEQRLMESHGIGVTQAIREFSKLDGVLREFFGSGAKGLETRFVQSIIKVEKSKDSGNWIVLKDQSLSQLVQDSFADPEKKAILEAVMDESLSASAILEKCKIATMGKLDDLVESGLLIPIFETENENMPKYQTPFSSVKMDIEKKSIVVKIQLQKNPLQQSALLQVIQ